MRVGLFLLSVLLSQSCIGSNHFQVEKILLYEVTTAPVRRVELNYLLPPPVGELKIVGIRNEKLTYFSELSISFDGNVNLVPGAVLSCMPNPDIGSLNLIYEEYPKDVVLDKVWISLGVEFYVDDLLGEADLELVGGRFVKGRASSHEQVIRFDSNSGCKLR